MIYPENTFGMGEPKMEEAATCSLVAERRNKRNLFHFFHVFFTARDASKGEGTRRNVNKGRKKKCSGIKVKHSHLLPFDLRDMDVGMSIA